MNENGQDEKAQVPAYSVHALMVGYSEKWPVDFSTPLYLSTEGRERPLPVPIWVIRGGGRTICIDTGTDMDRWWLHRWEHFRSRPLEKVLAEIGVDLASVDTLVLTHLHRDHCTGAPEFPHAKIVLQEAEYEFYVGDMRRHPLVRDRLCPEPMADYFRQVRESGQLELVRGDQEVAPGVRLLAVGGHTPGMQCVKVATSRGQLVLAGDIAYYYENIERRWPVGIFHDLTDTLSAMDRLFLEASSPELIIPGHDHRLFGGGWIVQLA